jgi:predicted ABC-type ATPase
MRRWKTAGNRIEIFYLRLDDVRLSLERIAGRVRSGGRDVPEADVRRRFPRSRANFSKHYQPLADASWVFDVNGAEPILLSTTP